MAPLAATDCITFTTFTTYTRVRFIFDGAGSRVSSMLRLINFLYISLTAPPSPLSSLDSEYPIAHFASPFSGMCLN